MAKRYDFHTQKAIGAYYERELDALFAEKFEIEYASRAEQRRGIDRWLTRNGVTLGVEIKADLHAHHTKTAFIETISVDSSRGRKMVPGWALTSEADLLLYYLPVTRELLAVEMVAIREALPEWERRYRSRKLDNGWYCTWGLIVPLWELERLSRSL